MDRLDTFPTGVVVDAHDLLGLCAEADFSHCIEELGGLEGVCPACGNAVGYAFANALAGRVLHQGPPDAICAMTYDEIVLAIIQRRTGDAPPPLGGGEWL